MATPTPADLRHLLADIAHYIHILTQDLHTQPLRPRPHSQTQTARRVTRPVPPCDIRVLDQIHTEVQPVLQSWAVNLAEDCGLVIPEIVAVRGWWAAWLNRHASALAKQAWVGDCWEELGELARQLERTVNQHAPQQSEHVAAKLPLFATAQTIADATGRSVRAIQEEARRRHTESYIINGKRHYRTRGASA